MTLQWYTSNFPDADLTPPNIKDGVDIFGVEGTYTGLWWNIEIIQWQDEVITNWWTWWIGASWPFPESIWRTRVSSITIDVAWDYTIAWLGWEYHVMWGSYWFKLTVNWVDQSATVPLWWVHYWPISWLQIWDIIEWRVQWQFNYLWEYVSILQFDLMCALQINPLPDLSYIAHTT